MSYVIGQREENELLIAQESAQIRSDLLPPSVQASILAQRLSIPGSLPALPLEALPLEAIPLEALRAAYYKPSYDPYSKFMHIQLGKERIEQNAIFGVKLP